MENFQREEILGNAKNWFKEIIAINHIQNTQKLSRPEKLKINPFLVKYLARFLSGSSDAISIAKVLIYARVLSSSINTSFGMNAQKFITQVLGPFGSTSSGIDIEFIDHVDGRKKYCQVKLGPETINKDDVETINQHFKSIKNLARTNWLNLEFSDLVVGVMYGDRRQLSFNYKKLEDIYHYPIYVGEEFWQRLTGSKNFYSDLSNAISEVAIEYDGTSLLEETVLALSKSDLIKNLAEK